MGFALEHNGSRYGGRTLSPAGVAGAIAVHATVVAVALLVPRAVYERVLPPTIMGRNIPIEAPPPDNPPAEDARDETIQPPRERTTAVDPVVPFDLPDSGVTGSEDRTNATDAGTGGSGGVIVPLDPPPVLVEPAIDPRHAAAFQPEYPGMMIRQGVEGKVTVRVTIGADGRVIDVERLAATSEAFWIETRRHALRKWRFRPATRDGVAVGGTKVLTVHFRLEN
ncbi:TonB family protein [Sphingobium sp. AN641]|uniref:energy transducer TonB n=1 Tax=Sphingobium sp. AN641 TaxID=3133443 RepID=UPI0030BC7C0B